MMSFTLPQYMVERVGSVTDDGIPLVFQANTFGHYYIVPSAIVQSSWQLKRLEPLLTATTRVQWSASLETSIPSVYDPLDPTGLHTHHPYASSKRFIELLHCYITSRPHKPLFFLTHPGITDSTVVTPYTFPLRETLQYLKVMAFYTARWCGSPWHGINGYTGALSQVWCALQAGREDEMTKWGCGSDRWGRERLIGTQLWGEADIFAEEARGAFEVAEGMYREWVFKLGVTEGKSNGEAH
jgi:3-keto steroid reductase